MSEFARVYGGMLWGIREWSQWSDLVARLKAEADDGWFVYYVGMMSAPRQPSSAAHFCACLAGIDGLLHQDHQERYLGIVYVDDREHPRLIKIYDPNNLGASCGSSGKLVPPGWILSRMVPDEVPGPTLIPTNRQRWWSALNPES